MLFSLPAILCQAPEKNNRETGQLLDLEQQDIGQDIVPFLHPERLDHPRFRGADLVFHLHGFVDQDDVVLLDLVMLLEIDLLDAAGNETLDHARLGGADRLFLVHEQAVDLEQRGRIKFLVDVDAIRIAVLVADELHLVQLVVDEEREHLVVLHLADQDFELAIVDLDLGRRMEGGAVGDLGFDDFFIHVELVLHRSPQ